MEAEIINIGSLAGTKKIRYYTVKSNGVTFYSDFVQRLSQSLDDKSELIELIRFIKNVGDWGYSHEYFKNERNAERILTPSTMWVQTNSEYGLRLYCIVVSPEIVILLNGDAKTELDPENCPNCFSHFETANKIASSLRSDIEMAVRIGYSGFEFEMDDDYKITY